MNVADTFTSTAEGHLRRDQDPNMHPVCHKLTFLPQFVYNLVQIKDLLIQNYRIMIVFSC